MYLIFAVVLIFYFYGFILGGILLVITGPLFKNMIHSCPYCSEILLTNPFYAVKLKDNVSKFNLKIY